MQEQDITRIECSEAPPAIGPYSQAISAGNFVFVSGQIALDLNNGQIISGGIKDQTDCVIKNTEKILLSSGLGLESVVKVEVFLTNIEDFAAMNEVYARNFNKEIKPARFVVEVAKLPKGALIEISSIAYKKK